MATAVQSNWAPSLHTEEPFPSDLLGSPIQSTSLFTETFQVLLPVVPAEPLRGPLDHPERESVLPKADKNLLSDDRTLFNLMLREEQLLARVPTKDYFSTVQHQIRPHMRTMVTEWMLEVCTEEKADIEVFPLAVSFLDRFLSFVDIFTTQLQALGCACIFLASKVKMPLPLTCTKLSAYTDDSVLVGELMSWELLILSRLDWDVSVPTPLDFLERILHRLSLPVAEIRADSLSLINRITKEYKLAQLPPSVQACLCVVASSTKRAPDSMEAIHSLIESKFGIESVMLMKDFLFDTVHSLNQISLHFLMQRPYLRLATKFSVNISASIASDIAFLSIPITTIGLSTKISIR